MVRVHVRVLVGVVALLSIGNFIGDAARVGYGLDLYGSSGLSSTELRNVQSAETGIEPQTITFDGGSDATLGLEVEDATGKILEVNDGQAKDKKVAKGWKIIKVGDADYSYDRMKASLTDETFEWTFQTWTYQKDDTCSYECGAESVTVPASPQDHIFLIPGKIFDFYRDRYSNSKDIKLLRKMRDRGYYTPWEDQCLSGCSVVGSAGCPKDTTKISRARTNGTSILDQSELKSNDYKLCCVPKQCTKKKVVRRRKLVRGGNARKVRVLPEYENALAALKDLDEYLAEVERLDGAVEDGVVGGDGA